MNSISGKLTAATIAATARMLRSAKKDVIFIVEGDDDIALFSNSLSLPRSNFISCFGKERLMQVFDLVPHVGLDAGTILLRDADCDSVGTRQNGDVLLLTSDYYDFEMSLLPKRVFGRIFSEFMKTKSSPKLTEEAYSRILSSSSLIGALRLLSYKEKLGIEFKEASFSFIDARTLINNTEEMVRYFFARSHIPLTDRAAVVSSIRAILDDVGSVAQITSGKDFLRVMSIALNRYFRCCDARECSFETLSRMFRMTVTQDDLRELSFYQVLRGHVGASGFEWRGLPL